MNFKKIIATLLLICLSTNVFAGSFIKKGQTFKATEDVRYFNYEEAANLLRDLRRKDQLEKENISLEKIVKNQDKELVLLRLAAKKDQKAATNYKASIAKLETSLKEANKGVVIYKEVITTKTKALTNCIKRIGRERGKRKIERVVYFIVGFILPIIIGKNI